MYKKGFNQYEVAEALGVKQASVSRWIACEAESGEDGLRCKPRTGPEPKLNGEQKNEELPRIKKRLRARLDADFRG